MTCQNKIYLVIIHLNIVKIFAVLLVWHIIKNVAVGSICEILTFQYIYYLQKKVICYALGCLFAFHNVISLKQ